MTTMVAGRPPNHRQSRRQPEPASIWLRLCAAAVDFSLVVGLAVVVNAVLPWQSAGASVAAADVLLALVEVVAGTSGGKLVVGLEVVWSDDTLLRRVGRAVLKYFLAGLSFLPAFFNRRRRGLHDMLGGSIVRKKPQASARVVRTLGAVTACLYVVVTFGCGRLLSHLVDERIDAERVDTLPAVLDPARAVESSDDWVEVWHQDLRLRLPRTFQGSSIQSGSILVVLGGGRGKQAAGPRLMIFFGDENHPFTQCSAPGPAWRHIVSCVDPQTAQRNVFAMRLADRRYLTPYGMAVTNGRLILKQQYLKGSPGRFFLRTYESGGLLVHWIGRQELPEKPDGKLTFYDDVLFATTSSQAGLAVTWADMLPDEQLIEAVIRSAALRPPTPEQVEAQVANSERTGDALGALNAMRAGHHERHVVEVATACLTRTGVRWEREVYARWLEDLAQKDGNLRDLAERTRAWLPPKATTGR